MLCLEQGTSLKSGDVPDPTSTGARELQHLGPYDVVCGRHKAAFNNIGNRRFRVTVSLQLARYTAAPTRKDKSILIKSVAALVRSNGGRFLQRKNSAWVELDEKAAHDKVGHALRDMAAAASAKGASASSTTAGGDSINGSSTVRTGLSSKASKASRRTIPQNIEVLTVTGPRLDVLPEWNDPMEDDPASGPEEEAATQEVQPEYEHDNFSVPEDDLISVDYSNFYQTNSESTQEQQQQQQQQQTDDSNDLEPLSLAPAEEQTSGVSVPQQQHQQGPEQDESFPLGSDPFGILDVEPLPWMAQEGGQRPSVDDHMLSWLVSESDTLLSGASSEC